MNIQSWHETHVADETTEKVLMWKLTDVSKLDRKGDEHNTSSTQTIHSIRTDLTILTGVRRRQSIE